MGSEMNNEWQKTTLESSVSMPSGIELPKGSSIETIKKPLAATSIETSSKTINVLETQEKLTKIEPKIIRPTANSDLKAPSNVFQRPTTETEQKPTKVDDKKSTKVDEQRSTKVDEQKSTKVDDKKSTKVDDKKSTKVDDKKSTKETKKKIEDTGNSIIQNIPPNRIVGLKDDELEENSHRFFKEDLPEPTPPEINDIEDSMPRFFKEDLPEPTPPEINDIEEAIPRFFKEDLPEPTPPEINDIEENIPRFFKEDLPEPTPPEISDIEEASARANTKPVPKTKPIILDTPRESSISVSIKPPAVITPVVDNTQSSNIAEPIDNSKIDRVPPRETIVLKKPDSIAGPVSVNNDNSIKHPEDSNNEIIPLPPGKDVLEPKKDEEINNPKGSADELAQILAKDLLPEFTARKMGDNEVYDSDNKEVVYQIMNGSPKPPARPPGVEIKKDDKTLLKTDHTFDFEGVKINTLPDKLPEIAAESVKDIRNATDIVSNDKESCINLDEYFWDIGQGRCRKRVIYCFGVSEPTALIVGGEESCLLLKEHVGLILDNRISEEVKAKEIRDLYQKSKVYKDEKDARTMWDITSRDPELIDFQKHLLYCPQISNVADVFKIKFSGHNSLVLNQTKLKTLQKKKEPFATSMIIASERPFESYLLLKSVGFEIKAFKDCVENALSSPFSGLEYIDTSAAASFSLLVPMLLISFCWLLRLKGLF